jgi:inorganic pyrophosphatase
VNLSRVSRFGFFTPEPTISYKELEAKKTKLEGWEDHTAAIKIIFSLG